MLDKSENHSEFKQGLTITDEYGNFTYCNQAYADIVEMDAADLIGRSPYDFIDKQSNKQLLKKGKVSNQCKTTRYLHTLIDSNGSKKKVSVTEVPIIEEGQFGGVVSVVSQVDTLDEIQRELVEKDQLLVGVSKAMNSLIMGGKFDKSEQKIELLASFPQQNPYPLLRVDEDYRFLYANPPGEKLQDFLQQKNLKTHKKMLQSALKSGNLKKYQIKMGERYYILNYAPIPNLDYVNIYGFDVTEKVEREKQLQKAQEIANKSLDMKEKFLSNMSHEIRTPLNGMNGIIHLLQSTELSELQKEYLDMLGTSSQHLLQLINEILDFSKLKQKKIELKTNPVDIKALIKESLCNIQESATKKGLDVYTEGLEIFQQKLVTNKVRLRQILLNLLTNAVKFTDHGYIKLVCRKFGNHANKMVFSISVIDTGIGIRDDDFETIFDSFNKVSNRKLKLYEGTGLGLSIVKELIHYMDGSLIVESKLGKGSTFTAKLELPFAKADVPKNNLTSKDSNKTLTGCKVLTVDDHKVNRLIIERILLNWGIVVLTAENGKNAIETLETEDVDIILMDMQMPVMDGIETTRTIRNSGKMYSKVPIIAMTAAAMPEQKKRCLRSGMNGYISKPYNPDRLFDELTYYFNKTNNND